MTDDQPTAGTDGDGFATGRRRFVQGSLAAIVAGALSSRAAAEAPPAAEASDWQALMAPLPKNWGRWGPEDGLGVINELGSEEMFAGMNAAMKRGKKGVERFALQIPMTGVIDNDGNLAPDDLSGGDPAFGSRNPAVRDNTGPRGPGDIGAGLNSADDRFITDFYLQGTTHLDSLGHVWVGDQIWNGFAASTTHTEETFVGDYDNDGSDETYETFGLAEADIANAGGAGIAGRGVLLDVARHENGDDTPLDLGHCIDLDDLQATARSQGVKLRERDILLIRTGGLKRYYDPAYEWNELTEPGICFSVELVEWIHDMDFPVLAADNIAVEKLIQTLESPADGEEKTFAVPLHPAMLQRLGVSLNEIVWLEDLAASCAEDDIYDFLYAGSPLNVERGTGAPINPVVIKATDDR